ncbi:MAG: YvcK family protein [Firmicutes bacterium]|nr:YvcK family protein [Bacillota bacterium]
MRRGPRVVAIGGGTGLSTLLRGLKTVTSNITAIVTVADDGGSSGRLRAEMGMPPPGDVRNTLVALADTEPLMERLFQYRFDTGSGLKGHSFGNLFLAAMTAITGDFERAVRESSKVLAVRGQVLPSTLESVTLVAEFADGTRARGESQVAQTGKRIRRVYLSPPDARPLADALRALREADIVILGPGSLYTSVLPNLLVPGIAETIGNSRAMRVYVCNVMSQPGETDGYRASDHVRALLEHAGSGIVDYVLMNSGRVPSNVEEKYRREGAHPVQADVQAVRDLGVVPVCRYLLSHSDFARHDPHRLAAAIRDMWETHRAASRARPVRTACRPAAGRRRQGR